MTLSRDIKEVTTFVWTDPSPRGGCHLCHRPIRRLDDAVSLSHEVERLDRRHEPVSWVEKQWLGSAHAQCAKEAGYEVFREIWGVIKKVRA